MDIIHASSSRPLLPAIGQGDIFSGPTSHPYDCWKRSARASRKGIAPWRSIVIPNQPFELSGLVKNRFHPFLPGSFSLISFLRNMCGVTLFPAEDQQFLLLLRGFQRKEPSPDHPSTRRSRSYPQTVCRTLKIPRA